MSDGLSMPAGRSAAGRSWARVVQSADPLVAAGWAAVVLGLALRLFARPDLPLWLDEAWTGAIVAQDSLGAVLRESLLDANAPLYFALMHGWSLLFGLSNGALRFPALVFGALAPLIALIPVKGMPRGVRYLWCALIALWIPGVWYSQEARCYTLLLLLAMACTVAYMRLLAQPDLRRATVWALLGALCILTHYHALVLVACQGLGYLALHRFQALRTWPAALIFAPALGWVVVHLPRLAQFADPQVAWFGRLGLADIPGIVFFMLGDIPVAIGLICVALIWLAVGLLRGATAATDTAEPPPSSVWIAVAIDYAVRAALMARRFRGGAWARRLI